MNEQTYLKIHMALSGELSHNEQQQFEQWLAESEQHQLMYQEAREAWKLAGNYRPPQFDAELALNNMPFFESKETSSEIRQPVKPKRIKIMRWSSAAAVAAIAVTAWMYIEFVHVNWDKFNGSETEFVTLDDDSRIHLDDDALIAAPEAFSSDERVVRLIEGDAFFDITSDATKPFVVETDLLDIEVLGTSFAVDIADDAESIRVDVIEGTVRLTPDGSTESITLDAGESGQLSLEQKKRVLRTLPQQDINDFAWHTGDFNFKDSPVADILDAVEESFDVTINRDDCAVLHCKLTIPFKDRDADDILIAISSVFSAELSKNDNGTFDITGGDSDCSH